MWRIKEQVKATFLHKAKGEEGLVLEDMKGNSLEIKIGSWLIAQTGTWKQNS